MGCIATCIASFLQDWASVCRKAERTTIWDSDFYLMLAQLKTSLLDASIDSITSSLITSNRYHEGR